MNVEQHKNMYENMAIESMKSMSKEDRAKCSRAVMKELSEKGMVSEDLCREIIELGMKQDREKFELSKSLETKKAKVKRSLPLKEEIKCDCGNTIKIFLENESVKCFKCNYWHDKQDGKWIKTDRKSLRIKNDDGEDREVLVTIEQKKAQPKKDYTVGDCINTLKNIKQTTDIGRLRIRVRGKK